MLMSLMSERKVRSRLDYIRKQTVSIMHLHASVFNVPRQELCPNVIKYELKEVVVYIVSLSITICCVG